MFKEKLYSIDGGEFDRIKPYLESNGYRFINAGSDRCFSLVDKEGGFIATIDSFRGGTIRIRNNDNPKLEKVLDDYMGVRWGRDSNPSDLPRSSNSGA